MLLPLKPPTPLDYFATLVAHDDGLPLLEAAAALAQDEYPEVSTQTVVNDVDQLTARVQRRLARDAGPLQRLRVLNQFLYGDLGFRGNLNHYHDPDNSYVHQVLRRRMGIPISMAVLWLELARGIGLRADGVAFPGHFLVKVSLREGQVVLDPLSGQSLTRDALCERLEPYRPAGGWGQDDEPPLAALLQAATPRAILTRMVHNLRDIHATQEDWPRLLAVLSRSICLQPQDWALRRDRGLAYAEVGQAARAVADLEDYLAHTPIGPVMDGAAERVALLERLQSLRRTLG